MKNILSIISLLLCTASISYGMSGEDHHDPGWFWSWGQSSVRPALPYLRTLGDTATEATRSLR